MLVAKVEHCQAVIYETLKQFLHESKASEASDHWRKHYAKGPVLALQRYVSDIYRDYQPSVERGVIYRALVNQLSTNSTVTEKKVTVISGLNQRHETTDYNQVFCGLIGYLYRLLNTVAPEDVKSFIHHMAQSIHSINVSQETKIALQHWLVNIESPLDIALSLKAMRSVVHVAYLALCQLRGPIEADRMLMQAVVSVKSQFPNNLDPKELL